MASPSYPVSSIGTLFSLISNRSPVLCLQLSFTPHFYAVPDEAPGSTSLLSFVSDVAAFSSLPLLRDCGFDLFRPFVEGLTEQWPGAGHTQEHLWDHAAANPRDCGQVSAPPQKKFTTQCSSSASGIIENHSTHLAPGFTLNDLVQHQ